MELRDRIKKLIKFARREFKEKHPQEVKVLRIKGETILREGFLPFLSIRKKETIQFVVLVDYGNNYRFYEFSKEAVMLGAENKEKSEKLEKDLAKSTSKIFHISQNRKIKIK